MFVTLIWFLIYCLLIGLAFYLVVWVLGLLGIPIPPRAMQIVGAIIFLILLLWFVQAVMAGGHAPAIFR